MEYIQLLLGGGVEGRGGVHRGPVGQGVGGAGEGEGVENGGGNCQE